MRTISLKQAQNRIIQSQRLNGCNTFSADSQGVAAAVLHLGYVQIDTISVVERAHHHTLWARIPEYKHNLLSQAIDEQLLFEYWSHAASYLPMENYRFCLPRMQRYASGEVHFSCTVPAKVKRFVLDRIRAEGPLQSKDFEHKKSKSKSVWFEWKPAKRALEQLFMEGKLLVRHRQGFQKVYDLAERVLPDHINKEPPSKSEYARFLILRTLRALSLASVNEIAYLGRKDLRATVEKEIKILLEEGLLAETNVKGIGNFYSLSGDDLDVEIEKPSLNILSPFDNLVIQRKRLKDFFGYDYMIECYVPEPKRKFGYFCLPLLHGTQFIGRMDAKADRKQKKFFVKQVWFEPSRTRASVWLDRLQPKLGEFAKFNGCDSVIFLATK